MNSPPPPSFSSSSPSHRRVWEACGIYSPVIFTSRGDTPLLSHLFLQRGARDYGEERGVGGCPGREVGAKSPLTSDCATGRARVTLTIIIVKQDAHRRRLLVHVRGNMTAILTRKEGREGHSLRN